MVTEKSTPKKQILSRLSQLGVALFLTGLAGALYSALASRVSPVFWGLAVGGLVVILIVARLESGDSSMHHLLQSRSSKELVEFYNHLLSPLDEIPDGDALLAYERGFVYALYGEFELARRELASVEWDNRPPGIKALPLVLQAWLCYLDTRDYKEGLRLCFTIPNVAG